MRSAVAVGAAVAVLTLSACASDTPVGGSSGSQASAGGDSSSSSASAGSGASGAAESSAAESSAVESSSAGGGSSAASSGAAGSGAVDLEAAKASLIDPTKLTVCTTLPFEPFESQQGDEVVGFDIDLVKFVADELGVQTEIIDTPFEGIKSGEANNSGKCDLSAAGMSITPERVAVMNFSDPYFNANFSLVVPASSDVKTLADLKGKRVGGQTSTTGLDYLNEKAAEFGYEVVEYTGFDLQSQAILTNQVDAVFNDVPVLKKLVDDNPSVVKVVDEVDTGDQYGFGMKKGNDALTAVVNSVITASKADGRYNDSYKKWFGTDAPTG